MKVQVVKVQGGFQVVFRGDGITMRTDAVPTLDEARNLLERVKSLFDV